MSGVHIRRGNLKDYYRGKDMWRHREKTSTFKLRRETSEEIGSAET